MPWSIKDIEGKIKGLTPHQKTVWVRVANSALATCLDDGRSQEVCEASAIKQANSTAKKAPETKKASESMSDILTEVGRMFSAANIKTIGDSVAAMQKAADTIKNMLSQVDSKEASKLLSEIAELSYGEKESQLRDSIREMVGGDEHTYVWLQDVYDAHCIYSVENGGEPGKIYRVSYDIRDDDVTIGTPEEVEKVVTYKPVLGKEASSEVDLTGDLVPLVEKAITEEGLMNIKVIEPGWGTSGYYSPELLARDGPTAFKKGTHMHVDHPTTQEEAQRPERSVKDLAAVLSEDAIWDVNGIGGAGIYAKSQVFEPYKEALSELAPHIGVSIRAVGKARTGEAEGKKGPVIEAITGAKSIDFVTVPGAGGKVMELVESVRNRLNDNQKGQEEFMNEEEAKVLRDAKEVAEAENVKLKEESARLREATLLREAKDFVTEALSKIEMPGITRARLIETLAGFPVLKEGKLDVEAYGNVIKERVKEELEYVGKAAGISVITGMGRSSQEDASAATATLKESYKNLYMRQGKSDEEAEKLAALAAVGGS